MLNRLNLLRTAGKYAIPMKYTNRYFTTTPKIFKFAADSKEKDDKDLDEALLGNKKFVEKKLVEDPEYFKNVSNNISRILCI